MAEVTAVAPAETKVQPQPQQTTEVPQQDKKTDESIFTKVKKEAKETTEQAKKIAVQGKDKAEEIYNNTKQKVKETNNLMNKGMKYSLLGIGTGFGLSGLARIVASSLKNKTAIKAVVNTGWVGYFLGVASLIYYGISATEKLAEQQDILTRTCEQRDLLLQMNKYPEKQ